MERDLHLRRVLLLCCHFARNLAYYRAAWRDGKHILKADFWVTTSGNSYDQCVLEWCKLFGEPKGEHFWGSVVADVGAFESKLYGHSGFTKESLESYRQSMRAYRDKFVAHLDLEEVADLPQLDPAYATVECLHAHVIASEIEESFIGRIPRDLQNYFDGKLEEGKGVYVLGSGAST